MVSREPGAAGREPGRRPERPRRRPQPGRGRPRHRRTDCAPVGDRGGTDTPRDRTCCPDAGGGQHHAAGTDTGHAADHVGDLQRGRVRPCSDSADSSSMSTEIVPSATTIPAPATTQSSTATDAGQPGTASSDWPPTRPRPRPGRGRVSGRNGYRDRCPQCPCTHEPTNQPSAPKVSGRPATAPARRQPPTERLATSARPPASRWSSLGRPAPTGASAAPDAPAAPPAPRAGAGPRTPNATPDAP